MLLSEQQGKHSDDLHRERSVNVHGAAPAGLTEQLSSWTASFTTNFAAISEAGNNSALNLVGFRTGSEELPDSVNRIWRNPRYKKYVLHGQIQYPNTCIFGKDTKPISLIFNTQSISCFASDRSAVQWQLFCHNCNGRESRWHFSHQPYIPSVRTGFTRRHGANCRHCWRTGTALAVLGKHDAWEVAEQGQRGCMAWSRASLCSLFQPWS